jgi:Tol biopolymer transport system component
VPIRINPATGLVDLVNGVFVDSRFPSLSADGRQVVFQVGNGTTAQIWQAVWDATNRRWEVKPIFDDDGDNRASEDPIDGNDNDNDGRVDEDPPEFGIHPVISADGNHIAFASWDDDRDGAVDEDPLDGQDNDGDGKIDEDPPKSQIYVLDRLQNRIVPISFLWRDTNGDGMRDTFVPSNGNCVPVAISADGRIVVFLAQSLDIVDANGDGTSDYPVNNPPSDWLVLIHDRDADGNGVYDEAGIGATRTFVGSVDNNGNPLPAASVSVSANGRIIAFATPANPANPDENWRVIVRDWQNGDQVEIPNAFAPALSDDGTYLAYLTPQQLDNDGDGQVNEDPVDGLDNDNDGKTDEDPVDFYPQTAMDLVVRQLFDLTTGQPLAQIREIRLSELQLPSQVGTADGSAGWGYSDWWGAVTIAVDPRDPNVNVVYAAFHAWSTELIELQNALLRDDDGDGRLDEDPINGRDDDGDGRVDEDPPVNFYQGVPNIFLARFDFGSNSVQLWRLLPPSSSPTPDWASRALPVSLERNGTIFRLPLVPSLLPTVSFVNGNQLAIVFQSLAAFDANDTNGLWDIYLANVLLP